MSISGLEAAFIASVCLFSTGHWIGGGILIVLIVGAVIHNEM